MKTHEIRSLHRRFSYAFASLLLGSVCLPLTAVSQTNIVNDAFSDNEFTSQSLPSSAAWYRGTNGASTWSAGTGALVHTASAGTGARATMGWNHFSSTTIQDGQTLSVSFNLAVSQINTNTNNRLDIGLFNSNGTQITANTAVAGDGAFTNDNGYKLTFNTGAGTTAASRWYERTTVIAENPFSQTEFTALSSAAPGETLTNAVLMEADSTIAVNVLFTRSGNTMTISSTVGSWTQTATDTSGQFTFDTFGFLYGSQVVLDDETITLDNFNVTSSAIPEPSAAALLVGGAILGLVGFRRRRT